MDAATTIDLTPIAAEKLRDLRGEDPTKSYLRLFVAGQGCCGVRFGLAFEEKTEPQDAVVESSGVPLTIDPESQPFCEGATIDYVETPTGAGFTVRGAAAAQGSNGGGCACGHGGGH